MKAGILFTTFFEVSQAISATAWHADDAAVSFSALPCLPYGDAPARALRWEIASPLGVRRMPRLLSCPRGHQWHDEARPGASAVCPMCGLSAAPVAPPEPSDNTATLLQAGAGYAGETATTLPHIDGFEIQGELGRGGMGIVYKARAADGRLVAIKVIRKDRLQHAEAVRRFRREAQAAARLDHPNIVHVLDSDHTGDTHYLVMEHVDGITLERLVEQMGPLPITRACDFIRQAALGLQHAHEQALVHRDIKPTNLMVTPAPTAARLALDEYQVKVLDMGVARVLQLAGGDSLSTLTQGGAVIGTADYVAPEQLEDPHGADIRADLYSLGCTFYFLLTGRVPFPGGSLVSKLDKQRWQTPTPVATLRDNVPAGVAQIVTRLMAKLPAERFSTPAALVEALEQLAVSGYAGAGRTAPALVETRRFASLEDAACAVCFDVAGAFLAAAGRDRSVVIYDFAAGAVVRTLPAQSQDVRALAYAPDGSRLASAAGLTLRLWEPSEARELRRFGGHSGTIKCLAFTGDGTRLVSGSDDKTARVWDLQGGHEALRLRHGASVTCLAVVPPLDAVLTGSRDETLRLWDLRQGQEVRHFSGGGGAVLAVAVAPAGRHAASAHFDTTVRLWDVMNGRAVRRFIGHKQMVSALAFTPDGRRLVSAGQDQTLRLWDVATGTELGRLQGRAAINALALHPGGRHVVSAGADGALGVIELPAPDGAAASCTDFTP
jgi:tRNA A-37 threonylcarbamoyl transferase component Bud32